MKWFDLATLSYVSLITCSAFASEVSLQSVRDSSNLMASLELLEEAASEGASIEAFSWTESFLSSSGGSCEIVSAAEVVSNFSEMAREIFDEREFLSPEVLRDFSQIIGKGNYRFCSETNFSGRSLDRISSYTSMSSPYKIRFIVSFED